MATATLGCTRPVWHNLAACLCVSVAVACASGDAPEDSGGGGNPASVAAGAASNDPVASPGPDEGEGSLDTGDDSGGGNPAGAAAGAASSAPVANAAPEEGDGSAGTNDDGSSGAPADPGAGVPDAAATMPCDAEQDIFPLLCGNIVCHEGDMNHLDLLSPGLEDRLLDVPAAGVFCGDSGLKLVDSETPANSLMLLKLTDAPPCGASMPLGTGSAGVLEADLECARKYIQDLASRSASPGD